MNEAVLTTVPAAPLKRIIPWTITVALLSVWAFGACTANPMSGLANGSLIAGAAMVLVSLFLGRRIISEPPLTSKDSP